MLPYFLVFTFLVSWQTWFELARFYPGWIVLQWAFVKRLFEISILILLLLFIGLRFEVGGDWPAYLTWYEIIQNKNIYDALSADSPAYSFLNWLFHKILTWLGCSPEQSKSVGIYFVNLVCAAFFLIGKQSLIKGLSLRPCFKPLLWIWAYHYMIIVVAMGYTRQAAAIGCFFIAIFSLLQIKPESGTQLFFRKSFLISAGAFFLAPLFHLSITPFLGFALLSWVVAYFPRRSDPIRKLKLISMGLIVGLFLIAAMALIASKRDIFIEKIYSYILDSSGFYSRGALPRLAITALSAVLVLFVLTTRSEIASSLSSWRSVKGTFKNAPKIFLILNCGLSILMLPIGFFLSTFADRLGLFLMPLQLVALALIAEILKNHLNPKILFNKWIMTGFTFLVITSSGILLWVWLSFSSHAQRSWIPYQNLLFNLIHDSVWK